MVHNPRLFTVLLACFSPLTTENQAQDTGIYATQHDTCPYNVRDKRKFDTADFPPFGCFTTYVLASLHRDFHVVICNRSIVSSPRIALSPGSQCSGIIIHQTPYTSVKKVYNVFTASRSVWIICYISLCISIQEASMLLQV